MWAYDTSNFDPPAPMARVDLRNPDSAALISDVPLLIDSGADVTLLPRLAVERLGMRPSSGTTYELIAFDGSKSSAPAVPLDLLFLQRAFRGQYLLIDQEYGVLGRDILNHLELVLDGPRLQWLELAENDAKRSL